MSVQRPPVSVVSPEADLQQFFSQGPRALRRSWVVATAVGESIGFLVSVLVGVFAFDLHPAASLSLMMLAGAVEGAVMGTAQAVVLRREFLGFSRTGWIVATSLAASFAWLVGMLPSTFASTWSGWPPFVTVPLGLVLAFLVLTSIGWAQATRLSRHVPRSRSWIVANAVAWAAGLGVLLASCLPLWQAGQPVILVVAVGVLGGLAMALTVAFLTGLWLARLVSPRDGSVAPRPRPAGVSQRDWVALGRPTDDFRLFDPTALDHLPDPVQRWMRHVITPGAALLTGVETESNGHVRVAATWRRFSARERASLHSGYVWSGRSSLMGMPLVGVDRYTRDQGELRWRLPGRLRVTKEAGSNASRSCAARHAAGLFATAPAVALHPSVRWEDVDHDRATAHIVVDDEDQAVTVTVDPSGRLRQVEVDRWGTPPNKTFGPYRYGALLGEERSFGAYLVPTEVVAGWQIGTERWETGSILRYRIVRCAFH